MSADVVQLRDYDWQRPVDDVARGPAVVVILPVVRVERLVMDMMTKPPRAARHSLLGDL